MSFEKSIDNESLKALPIKRFKGEIILVETETQVDEAVDYLSRFPYIGFDTESKPIFEKGKSNKNPISLVQLSTNDKAYIIRIPKTGWTNTLIDLMENDKVLKIGAAIHGDFNKINKSKNQKGIEPRGFVDIQKVAKSQGILNLGLKKLTSILLGFRISKRFQVTNWDAEVLSEGQLNYAATDAWACYVIYENFIQRGFVPQIH
ncbi:MAG: 3'-5' exonuclease domain-containing protein 2 [Bacteroidales bacterium]|nr:3'-5' exonuclease domain-containing protein 2 [Bacteroidales bacterium]